jgi:hypothetical protein
MEILPILLPLLQGHFDWNLARAKCIAALIAGLIKVRSVNLVKLATALPGQAQKESKYRRLQRLFSEFPVSFSLIALFIASQLPYDKYTLTMDRTNWKYGNTHINILFLGIVHQGAAIPILWITLSQEKKSGNSNADERIALMELFIEIFGAEKIESYLADREFIGKKWISYLLEKIGKFRIRIKRNTQISRTKGGFSPARNFFRNLQYGEGIQLKGKRKVFGLMLYVTGMRLPNGDYLIIVSDDSASCERILNDYKQRWEIETLFKALKSQGFDFEDTHLVDREKIDKLIAFLAIAFLWAHKTGEWLHERKPIKIKSHKRKAISIFRYGLDHLREIFLNITEKMTELQNVSTLLQPTPIRSDNLITT